MFKSTCGMSERIGLNMEKGVRTTHPFRGQIEIRIERKDGSCELRLLPNTVVWTGEDLAAQLLRDPDAVPITAMAIGSSGAAVSKGDTLLLEEITTAGGGRAAASKTQGTKSNEAQFYYQWTFSGTLAIREAGLFNTTAANSKTMFARNTFAVINVTSDDKLALTWVVTAGTAR